MAEKWNSGDKCSSEIPLRPGALVWGCGARFWGIHNLFWIMCFSDSRVQEVVCDVLPGASGVSFIKYMFSVNYYLEQGWTVFVWWGWLPCIEGRLLCTCLHFPWWWCPVEVTKEQGRERMVGEVETPQSPVCWKELPPYSGQDTKTKISSSLPCLRQPSKAMFHEEFQVRPYSLVVL